jgi:hypothetical protein
MELTKDIGAAAALLKSAVVSEGILYNKVSKRIIYYKVFK